MWQNDQVGLQSMEMLKVRAALEERLKQKGVFGSIAPKRNGVKRNLQPLNGYALPYLTEVYSAFSLIVGLTY